MYRRSRATTAGTLSQAVAHAALVKAEEELRELKGVVAANEERELARIVLTLPQAAGILRERVRGGDPGVREPRSMTRAREILFRSFGGRIPVRPGTPKSGEKPYLIARVAPNRAVLLEAVAGAGLANFRSRRSLVPGRLSQCIEGRIP